MNDAITADAARKQFDEAVRTYAPKMAGKLRQLLPFKEGIAELRGRGASYATIAGILRDVGVTVSRDTVTRFCTEVLKLTQPHAGQRQKSRRIAAETLRNRSPKKGGTMAENMPTRGGPSADAPRTGPRIADPNSI